MKGIELPRKVIYVSISRSIGDLDREISHSYAEENQEFFRRGVTVKDFSGLYMKVLPKPFGSGTGYRGVLTKLMTFLKQVGGRNLVTINSLTDLALVGSPSTDEIAGFVKWLQRMTKRWGGVVYLLLDKGVLEKMLEKTFSSRADGVIRIRWDDIGVNRVRTMGFYKFRGLFTKLGKISRYEIKVSRQAGFTVSKWEMVEGIR
ncbi:MAG TPA: hypothetical protein EYP46_00515 [Hadesarchaea archaeon]|nr:hypothetical protein [Hadesarchaea archaeon]